jgi:hypothetical protein
MITYSVYQPDGKFYALFLDRNEAEEEADACGGEVRVKEVDTSGFIDS